MEEHDDFGDLEVYEDDEGEHFEDDEVEALVVASVRASENQGVKKVFRTFRGATTFRNLPGDLVKDGCVRRRITRDATSGEVLDDLVLDGSVTRQRLCCKIPDGPRHIAVEYWLPEDKYKLLSMAAIKQRLTGHCGG